MSKTLTESDLSQFTGTETWYKHWLPRFLYTEGVRHVAEAGEAYWLIDAIASHQIDKKVRALDMQFWRLELDGKGGAVLTCREDSGIPPVVTQTIEYSDFPFSIDIWVGKDERGAVAMLKSEY